MIFYGTNSSVIKNGQIRNIVCPHCQAETSMNYSVYGRYTHVYWIPFFPLGKSTITECNSCKRTFDFKDLPVNITSKYLKENQQNPAKTPLKHFSLLILGGIGVIAAVFLGMKSDDDTKLFAKNPKAGDMWHYKTSTGWFSLAKVDKVTSDSIYVTFNDQEIEKKNETKVIDKPENYTTDKYTYTKKDLLIMQAQDTIYEIDRN